MHHKEAESDNIGVFVLFSKANMHWLQTMLSVIWLSLGLSPWAFHLVTSCLFANRKWQ